VDPVPDPLLLRKSGSAGDRTRVLCICSQKLWPLDHRGGPSKCHIKQKMFFRRDHVRPSVRHTLLATKTVCSISWEIRRKRHLPRSCPTPTIFTKQMLTASRPAVWSTFKPSFLYFLTGLCELPHGDSARCKDNTSFVIGYLMQDTL